MAVTISGTSGITTPGMSSSGDITLAGSGVELLNNSGRIVVGQSGSVIQVVSSTLTTMVTGTADVWTDVLSVSITPTSTSSKVLVMFSTNFSASGNEVNAQVLRNGSSITGYTGGDVTNYGWTMGSQYSATGWGGQSVASQYLDSPASTSALTYKLQAKQNVVTLYVNRSSGTTVNDSQGGITTITVMEIAQ